MDAVRYRGDSPAALADAVIALLEYARNSGDDFEFGPLRLHDLERDGLLIEGDNLTRVTAVLATIAGIAVVDS